MNLRRLNMIKGRFIWKCTTITLLVGTVFMLSSMFSLNKSNFLPRTIGNIRMTALDPSENNNLESIRNTTKNLQTTTIINDADFLLAAGAKPQVIPENQEDRSKPSEDYLENLQQYILKWKRSLESGKTHLQTHFDLLDYTHDLMMQEQKLLPHNVTQRPVPLSLTLNCANAEYATFLNPVLRDKPQHVIDLIIFAYEMSIIEIRLFEFYDVVDEFIIFETNMTFKSVRKPFFFLDHIERYTRFLDKITLITPFNLTTFNSDGTVKKKIDLPLEDIPREYRFRSPHDVPHLKNENDFFRIDWAVESQVRMIPLDLYTKYIRKIGSDEIIVHGDVDEMPSGNVINHFKHCQVKDLYPFNVWSTFYTYGFKFLFQADFAAPSDIYSNLFPNVFQMKNILALKSIRSKGFVLPRASGAHCNRFFTTFTIPLYKDMSQSDSTGLESFHLDIIMNGSKDILSTVKSRFDKGDVYHKYIHRIKKFNIEKPDENGKSYIPWIVLANKYVYEKFF